MLAWDSSGLLTPDVRVLAEGNTFYVRSPSDANETGGGLETRLDRPSVVADVDPFLEDPGDRRLLDQGFLLDGLGRGEA